MVRKLDKLLIISAHFPSFTESFWSHHHVYLPLFNPRIVNCENAACTNVLRWQNGQPYTYPQDGYTNIRSKHTTNEMKVNIIGPSNRVCVEYRPPSNDIVAVPCEHWLSYFCEFDCDNNGALGEATTL